MWIWHLYRRLKLIDLGGGGEGGELKWERSAKPIKRERMWQLIAGYTIYQMIWCVPDYAGLPTRFSCQERIHRDPSPRQHYYCIPAEYVRYLPYRLRYLTLLDELGTIPNLESTKIVSITKSLRYGTYGWYRTVPIIGTRSNGTLLRTTNDNHWLGNRPRTVVKSFQYKLSRSHVCIKLPELYRSQTLR